MRAETAAGQFAWNAVSLTADDGVTVIKPDDLAPSAPGRWLKIVPPAPVPLAGGRWIRNVDQINTTFPAANVADFDVQTGPAVDVVRQSPGVYRLDADGLWQIVVSMSLSVRAFGSSPSIAAYAGVTAIGMQGDSEWRTIVGGVRSFQLTLVRGFLAGDLLSFVWLTLGAAADLVVLPPDNQGCDVVFTRLGP